MLCILLSMVETPEDKRKVEQLYDEYNRLMYACAFRILRHHEDAEDAVFTSWEKIIRNLEKINKIKCKKTKSFIVIIVERTAIDIYRKKRDRQENLIDEYEEVPYYATKEMGFSKVEMMEWINSIPKIYSEVLILYYVNGLTQEEIANVLSLNRNTVSSRLFRGKKLLAERGGMTYE